MRTAISAIAAILPEHWQLSLKRILFAWKIKAGRFVTNEPEFRRVENVIQQGDTVLDVGASVGVYTRKFSELVGPSGRVIAFEPIPESFYLLVSNTHRCRFSNVTLLQMAASDRVVLAPMTIPRQKNRLRNYYRASLVNPNMASSKDTIPVLCYPLDSLVLPGRIRLVKIDVEGYEAAVLKGMSRLIERDKPVLIVEAIPAQICEELESQGYRRKNLPGSPNTILEYKGA